MSPRLRWLSPHEPRLNVLFVTMQYGPGYSQGSERYIAVLADGLQRRGHTASVLAGDPRRVRPRDMKLGESLPEDPAVAHYPSRGWMSIQGVGGQALERALRGIRPDVVHMVNPGHVGLAALQAAQRVDIPTVITVVDYWWLCPKHTLLHSEGHQCSGRVPWTECIRCIALERDRSWRQRLARRPRLARTVLPIAYLSRWAANGLPATELMQWPRRQRCALAALQRASAVIFLSRTAGEILQPFLSNPRVFHITNGLEDWWFSRSGSSRPSSSPKLTLGFAGALTPHKGAHLLLEAAASLPRSSVRLRIAGPASDVSYQKTLAALARGLDVEFVGSVPARQMPAFMRSVDLLVVPSVWPENLPMVVLEAYASETPVIGSDVGGIAEYVNNREMLFQSGSAEALANCVRRCCERGAQSTIPRVRTAGEMTASTLEVYELARQQRATRRRIDPKARTYEPEPNST